MADNKNQDQNDGKDSKDKKGPEDEEKQRIKERYPFRKRLSSFRTFLTHFYVEQKENPFQSLIGPGPGYSETFWLTHLWYIFILSFIPVCSLLSTIGFIQPYLVSENTLCDWKKERASCQTVIIVFITYRIGFSVSLFFLFTALLLSKRKSRDIQQEGFSTLHTGFWIEKVIVVLVLSCVAFAFPPVVFDVVWAYVVFIGDIILTCVMLFLTCDFVVYLNDKIINFIIRKKWDKENGALEMIHCSIAIFTIIGMTLASVYTIESMKQSRLMTAYITVMTVYLTGQLIYIRFERQTDLVNSLYATAFIFTLMWTFIINYRQYTEPTSQQGVWTPSNAFMFVMLYVLVVYAVIREDDRSHFYYFYWTVCSGGSVDRVLDIPNQKHYNTNAKPNLNETLIDCSPAENEGSDSSSCDVVYNESFMHLFLYLVSLKSTAVVTNYNVLIEIRDELKATKTFVSILSLYISSLIVLILFTGYLARSSSHHTSTDDPLSVGLLLKSIFQGLNNYASKFLFGKPRCLSRSFKSRFVYFAFFTVCFVLACIVISPSFKHYFQRTSLFCDHVTTFGACMSHDPTYTSLYRIFASAGFLFMLLGVLTFNGKLLKRLRDDIQNGCWPVKLVILFAIFASVVNLPNSFSRYWLYFDMLAILVFSLLQLFCLLDAITLATKSLQKDTKSEISPGSIGVTCLLYVISIVAYVSFYIFYAHNYQCSVTRFFVSINLVLCLSASVMSIHPDVRNGSLLLSAVVTSFCMYSTWAALNYNPAEKCNPLAHSLMLMEARPGRDAVSVTDLVFLFTSLIYFIIRVDDVSRRAYDLSLRFLVDCICCNYENKKLDTIQKPTNCTEKVEHWLSTQYQPESVNSTELPDNNENNDQEDAKNTKLTSLDTKDLEEFQKESYCYSAVHFICSMACSYAFLLLAHWLEPVPGSGFKVSLHWAIMSVKLVSSSVSVLIYIWILIVPVIRNRLKGVIVSYK